MSAPNTDLEKQERRHRGPLRGMAGVLIFAAILLVVFIAYMFASNDGVEGADEVIDGRTGEVEDAAPGLLDSDALADDADDAAADDASDDAEDIDG